MRAKVPAALALVTVFVLFGAARRDNGWVLLQAARPGAFSYRQFRIDEGFKGLPIETLRVALDRRLPGGAPVAFGPEIDENTLWSQRLVEGLYPRPVVATAPARLRIRADEAGSIAVFGNHGFFHLEGANRDHAAPPPADLHTQFHFSALVFALLGLAGWGLAAVRALGVPAGLGSVTLAAYLVTGGCAHLATWLQWPLFGFPFLVTGAALSLAIFARAARRLRVAAREFEPRTLLRAESGLLLAGVTIALVTFYRLPILGWDGRSIWFFHAHELGHKHMFALADALMPAYKFNHPTYPLAFPAWLAAFGTSAGGYLGERQASIGIAFLVPTLLSPLFDLLRRRTSRAIALLFSIGIFATSYAALAAGYPDPVVTLLLCIGVLAIDEPETYRLGLLALAAAALTKREGLVFAGMLLAALSLLPWKRAWPILRTRVLSFAVFLPAAIHAAWARLHRVPDLYERAAAPATVDALVRRLVQIGAHTAHLLVPQPVILLGAIGTALALGRLAPAETPTTGRRTAIATLFCLVAVTAIFLVSPFNLDWHLETALPRLLATLAVLGVLAGVLQLSARVSGEPR